MFMHKNTAKLQIALFLAVLLSGSHAYAQSPSLSLASGSAVQGSALSLNLSLNGTTSLPASLEWTISYPSSAITTLSTAAGSGLTAAGKTLNCNAGVGTVTCLVSGMNANTVSGVVAVVTATLSATSTASPDSLTVSAMGALPDGTNVTIPGGIATISVLPRVSGLQCSPNSVMSGGTSSCTITLAMPAPSGGAVVGLSDNNTSALSVPASATVAAGATTGTFTATAGTVTGNQTVTVTASLNNTSTTGTVTVTPTVITVTRLQCSPSTVVSGGSTSCTVTVSPAAPTGGSAVAISDNNASLPVPGSVTVAAGATTASFTATAGTVTGSQAVTVTATLNGTATASVTVNPAPSAVTGLVCSPSTVVSGGSTSCTVTVSPAAPTGGSAVAISDNNGALPVPTSVTVAAGATTASFTATAGTVTGSQAVTVTATLNGSKTASVTVNPAPTTVTGLACSPTTVSSGGTSACTVTVSPAAPTGGSAVNLSVNDTWCSVPASVTVGAGATTAGFTMTAGTVTTSQGVTVTATLNGTATASLTVNPAPITVTNLVCSPTTVNSGGTTSCTVTVSPAAPTGGSAVAISDNSTYLTSPTSVTVAYDATTASFTATAGTVTSNQSVTLTATLNGTAMASVTIQPSTSSTNLAAAYGFSEGSGSTTADNSGNGNTGTFYGATWTTSGKDGTALSLNGNSAYVDLGNGPTLQGTGSMTWSAWVYATGNPSDDGNIVAKSGWGSKNAGWQFKSTPDCGSQTFGILISSDGTNYTERCGKTVRALKTWYYVAAVYNASARTLDVYVNGVLDDGSLYGTIPSAQFNPALDALIGKRNGGLYFKGYIDDVRIYNQALTQAQIQSDMNTPVTASMKPSLMTGTSNPDGASLSELSCMPKVIAAGGQATCELRGAGTRSGSIQVSSSSQRVKTPAAVLSGANPGSLKFQVSADAAARQEQVKVTAAAGNAAVQDTIQVAGTTQPVVTVPDNQAARRGVPVRFLVGAADPTNQPVQLAAADLPAGATFDAASGHFRWTPTAAQTGKHQVTFTATNAAGESSSAQVAIDVSSGDPVLEAAERMCSPGGVASLSGRWLGEPGTISDPTGSSMELGGTKVRVNGQYVPVLLASPTQVRFLCPALDPETQLAVAVETDSGATAPLSMVMQSASPWILSLEASGENQAVIRGSGFGLPAGISTRTVSVKLGDVDAEVKSVSAVPGYAGVYAVEVGVPGAAALGGSAPVELQVVGLDGKLFHSNSVRMAVEPANEQ